MRLVDLVALDDGCELSIGELIQIIGPSERL
jgi:hypothetical protein